MDEKIADGIIVGGHMERYTTYFGVHLKFFKTKFFLNFFKIFFIFLRTAVCSSMLPQDEAPCAPRPQPPTPLRVPAPLPFTLVPLGSGAAGQPDSPGSVTSMHHYLPPPGGACSHPVS